MKDDLLQGLNPAQQEAVCHQEGPLLVLAGPGSGKTRVVTHRIARLLRQGVYGNRIAALTFTNKAADEMKNRLAQLAPNNRVWIGTFHRFCATLLRGAAPLVGLQPNFTIYDADQSKRLLEGVVEKKSLPTGIDSAKIAAAISWAKNGMILPGDYVARPGHLLGAEVERVYPLYQNALHEANAVDFDDLLVQMALALRDSPDYRRHLDERFQYILIDEYQDTNLVQYAIARALSVNYPNLGVTGDPDQSIYGWRGANIRNILDFEKDFENTKVIRLEQNYRSSANILAAASQLIKKNKQRKDKELFTANPPGTLPQVITCDDHRDEAESIAKEIAKEIQQQKRKPRDFAIFYRTNALSRNLEHALHQYGVPFQLIRGLEFFNRKEIKDILSYFQLLYNPSDFVSFKRVINLPARGIGQTTIVRLEHFAKSNALTLMEAATVVEKIPAIAKKTREAITSFVRMMNHLRQIAVDSDLEVLLSYLLQETGYLKSLQEGESEEDKDRLANVQELLSEVREFDQRYTESESERSQTDEQDELFQNINLQTGRLGRFLEQAALVNDIDDWNDDSDRVSLMTLHAAKGLEFPVVYIIALEENILPHERSKEESALEEERRLLFVGMTRAKEVLRLTKTIFREFRGMYNASITSRFLFDIPTAILQRVDSNNPVPSTVLSPKEKPAEKPIYLSDQLDSLFTPREVGAETEHFFQEKANGLRKKGAKKKTVSPIQQGEVAQPGDVIFVLGTRASRPHSSADVQPGEVVFIPDESFANNEVIEGDEIVFVGDGSVDFVIPVTQSKKMGKKPFIPPSAITTASALAAEMGQETSREQTKTPFALKPEMLVRHQDYGIGVVKKIQGPRSDRIATIEFLSGVGTVEIPLAENSLQPLPARC